MYYQPGGALGEWLQEQEAAMATSKQAGSPLAQQASISSPLIPMPPSESPPLLPWADDAMPLPTEYPPPLPDHSLDHMDAIPTCATSKPINFVRSAVGLSPPHSPGGSASGLSSFMDYRNQSCIIPDLVAKLSRTVQMLLECVDHLEMMFDTCVEQAVVEQIPQAIEQYFRVLGMTLGSFQVLALELAHS